MRDPDVSPAELKQLPLDPRIGLAACAILGVAVGAALLGAGLDRDAAITAGIAVVMATAWVSEVVPIPVTSLFPIVLFPAFGIAGAKEVAASYGKPTIYLFLGGFLLALGLQRCGLHRRIALRIVAAIGSRPSRLVLGFMLSSALLSMWISNTASVLVMMPIGLAVLEQAKDAGVDRKTVMRLGTAMMLGIAYAADIGGMATPIGTPPNLVLLELHGSLVPGADELGFGQWMVMGLPLAALFLSSGWFVLMLLFRFERKALFGGGEVVNASLRALGPIRRDELVCGGVFALTAIAWMTGSDLRLGELTITGWRNGLGLEGVGDASVAVFSACLLFAIPSGDHRGETLMTWETAKDVPWGILLLFGGGFALAMGFEVSGLSVAIGEAMAGLAGTHPIVIMVVVCLVVTFVTELTSNTATTTLMLPILARTADSLGVDPLLLMIPATLSASCAFMMPVASPTQAIVFGSGYVNIRDMVRAGIWFNLLGVLLVSVIFVALAGPLFGVSM